MAPQSTHSPCGTSSRSTGWFYFFTIVLQSEHFNWLVVYGWSVFLPHFGHLWPLAIGLPPGLIANVGAPV
ncbi:hypothetical protein BN10_300080 [Phycicoccus elongatus Lp2]|uniref:Uncharacterized protein n=1 Tax=Phycicoccus elongatus Lp2 TaxID=1193181 RepID=N0E478_9MICO|nr:hypothetical protein BN10_300080 [Phycicoccus elongatus Lp2]